MGYIILIAAAAVVTVVATCRPDLLGDENAFMNNFVDQQMLSILGVIIAIFLPSAAGLHVKLSEVQNSRGVDLSRYKRSISYNCLVIITLFVITVVLLIVKGGNLEIHWLGAVINGITLIVLLANIVVLIDITKAMFVVGEVSFGSDGLKAPDAQNRDRDRQA